MNKKEAKATIEKLVEKFDSHHDDYKRNSYLETPTRIHFVNPFFEALGWDINDKLGLGYDCEVIHEDSIIVDGVKKAPDYCFKINGTRKFFLEAKRPGINIKEHIEPAYQLRRYAWNAKLPVSILTDFEEFSVYDCAVMPLPNDRAIISRIKYFNYKDYINEFDFLWDTFSKENVIAGSLDKYALANKSKKGTEGVDAEFLKSLNSWRDVLARNLVIRNSNINEDELNYAIQKIIDRIIFLRICEDRGIEPELQLFKTIGSNTYSKLKNIFNIADQKYNSGLFDFRKDVITGKLNVDDKALKTIIEEMYYPKSPYEFSVIPVEILGHSYEQYLGKVIKIDEKHKISIDEKPEVRKAGGVYYTPQYIVDYIVKNTVGKIVDSKTPDDVAKIKIVDPACGSGSFLLGAYKYLLEWHIQYYQNAKLKNKTQYLTNDGRLTNEIKKKILTNNIFGVDIDTNAVEVTKLSLMLQVMEGETSVSIDHHSQLIQHRVLPSLDKNILSGNSLIDFDFYDNQINFEPGAEKKIKPFNWKNSFPEVFKQGGFDVVIGNPPYVDSEEMVKTNLLLRNYCNNKYKTANGNWDLYCVFSEKSIDLLRDNGRFGFITPNKFLSAPYGDFLKSFFSNFCVEIIADYSSVSVFVSNNKKINVYPVITIINKQSKSKNGIYQKYIQNESIEIKYEKKISIQKGNTNWSQQFDISEQLSQKIIKSSSKISSYFVIENSATVSEAYKVKEIISELNSSSVDYFKFVNTGTIDRYSIKWGISKTQYIKDSYKNPILSKKRLKADFPKRFETASKEKIILAGMIKELEATYDNGLIYTAKSTTMILKGNNKYDLKYLLGLINSKLYSYIFTILNKYNTMSGGYMNVGKNQLEEFIFFPIDYENKFQLKHYNEIISLVDTMLQLNKDLQKATLPEQKEQLKARIQYTDKKIDKLVYELFELTEEEIKIVEGE